MNDILENQDKRNNTKVLLGVMIFPTQIELGTFAQGNKRKIKFNKDNPKHIKMFEKFYDLSVSNMK
jgi:hypothetical protein